MSWSALVLALAMGGALVIVWAKLLRARRAEFIRNYSLPPGLFEKLRKKRPELTLKDCQLVGHALRQFFLVYLKSGCRYVSMPSQVVDDMWHELILYTRNYETFCRRAFGQFLHHTPAVVLSTARLHNEGLRRCWWFACREENINPRKATRLPLLFAIDRKLGIKDGFVYFADCAKQRPAPADSGGSSPVHCGGDFQSASYDGGIDGFGDSGSDGGGGFGGGGSSDGGCSGGCGGD